jgi:hypothetical protein
MRRKRLKLASLSPTSTKPENIQKLMEVIVMDFNACMDDPLKVWDAKLEGYVMVVPVLMCILHDEPEMANCANMTQHGGIYACTKCEVQGTNAAVM